jgi:hypothetical protein
MSSGRSRPIAGRGGYARRGPAGALNPVSVQRSFSAAAVLVSSEVTMKILEGK